MRVILAVLLATLHLLAEPQTTTSQAGVEGLIVNSVTGNRLGGVLVVCRMPALTSAPSTPAEIDAFNNPHLIETVTDSEGRFVLDQLETGKISLTFSKPGYPATTLFFTLAAGQHLKEVRVSLVPMGVVTGKVVHPSGEPVVRAQVTPLSPSYAGGGINDFSFRGGGATTDDRGEFRLFNLPPGSYLFYVASQSFYPAGQPFSEPPEVSGALYPGVSDIPHAAFVEVQPGRETHLNDMILRSGGYGTVRVHLTNSSGANLKDVAYGFATRITTMFETDALGFSSSSSSRPTLQPSLAQASPGADIVKTHYLTVPGNYEATASWKDAVGRTLTASVTFAYSGLEMDIALDLSEPRGRLSCRPLLEDESGSLQALANVKVQVRREASLPVTCHTPAEAPGLPAIPEGLYRLSSLNPPPDTYVVSVRQGDRNSFLEGVNVTREDMPVDILVRSRAGVLRGRVTNRQNLSVHGAVVVLVSNSTNPSLFLPAGISDPEGDFELRGIAPGSYTVYATDRIAGWDYPTPVFTKKFEGKGRQLTISRGEQLRLDLKLANEP